MTEKRSRVVNRGAVTITLTPQGDGDFSAPFSVVVEVHGRHLAEETFDTEGEAVAFAKGIKVASRGMKTAASSEIK